MSTSLSFDTIVPIFTAHFIPSHSISTGSMNNLFALPIKQIKGHSDFASLLFEIGNELIDVVGSLLLVEQIQCRFITKHWPTDQLFSINQNPILIAFNDQHIAVNLNAVDKFIAFTNDLIAVQFCFGFK